MVERVQLKDIELTRHVRTEAGVRKYHKPIGTPLGGGHTPTKKIVHEAKRVGPAKSSKPVAKVAGAALAQAPKVKAEAAPTVEAALKDPAKRKQMQKLLVAHNEGHKFIDDEFEKAEKEGGKAIERFFSKLYSIAPWAKNRIEAIRHHPATKGSKKVLHKALDLSAEAFAKHVTEYGLGAVAVQLGIHLLGF